MDTALENGFERGQGFERGVAQTLVTADVEDVPGQFALFGALGRLEAQDLAVESTLVPCLAGVALTALAERVDVGARDAAAFGDPFGGLELVRHVDVPRIRVVRTGIGADVRAERNDRHRLHPAGDADVDRVGGDEPGDQMVGLLRRTALRVDGGRSGRLRQTRGQPGLARDVAGLGACLGHAAADRLLDEGGVEARLLEEAALGDAEQLLGV